VIGFVHSGNAHFPKILEDRFACRFAELALDHRLKIVPYTLNLLDALALFESLGIAETVALCHPLINIQGETFLGRRGRDRENENAHTSRSV